MSNKVDMNELRITQKEDSVIAEMAVDTKHVCISTERYEQLLMTETMLAVVQKVCRNAVSYQITDFLKILFPADFPEAEKEDA